MIKKNDRHILLVDDDPHDLSFMKAIIEEIDDRYRYHIYCAKDASEAINIYARKPVECALIDYNMPDVNGVNLINLLSKLPSHIVLRTHFPVVVVSGIDDPSVLDGLDDADAVGFTVKRHLTTPQQAKQLLDGMLLRYEFEKAMIA